MNILFVLFIAACAVLPGIWMLLFPEKAFTTAAKPRWIGFPFLMVGLLMLFTMRRLLLQMLNVGP